MKKWISLISVLALLFSLSACGQKNGDASQNEEDGLTLLATTYPVYLLASAVAEGAEGVTVERLNTGAVSCLHDYTLSVGDMKRIEGADILAINGVDLEEFMSDALAASRSTVIDCSQGIELLESLGLIKLDDSTNLTATPNNIVENPKNLEFMEMEAAQLPRSLDSLDIAVINGNYAIDAGLKVADALAIESSQGTAATAYANVLVVKEGHENDEGIQALVKALQSDEVKQFIEETYDGAVVPLF